MGIEPMRSDFADHRVSTSPYHHVHQTGKWAKKSSGTRFPELVIPHRQVVPVSVVQPSSIVLAHYASNTHNNKDTSASSEFEFFYSERMTTNITCLVGFRQGVLCAVRDLARIGSAFGRLVHPYFTFCSVQDVNINYLTTSG
jgi:hypothetical protein